ncbi:hypothetical protein GCM10028824_26240 [Hymenobacter segetis]
MAILDSQSVKNTTPSTARVGDDAGKHIKGRKRFFLVDTTVHLLVGWVVVAACHAGATTARLWDVLPAGNELLDRLQTVFVDGGFDHRFRLHLARHGVPAQVPSDIVADNGRFFIHANAGSSSAASAWAAANRRLAKDYERKTTHANAWLYLANIRRLSKRT